MFRQFVKQAKPVRRLEILATQNGLDHERGGLRIDPLPQSS
jgi:hypothetical protein